MCTFVNGRGTKRNTGPAIWLGPVLSGCPNDCRTQVVKSLKCLIIRNNDNHPPLTWLFGPRTK